MSMNNLTIDGEFRYIIQWFNEWSELQRDDFIPIMVDYLTDTDNASSTVPNATATINMNGLETHMERSLNLNDKPMSLFQCRVKLFSQWNRRWPIEFKEKLQQKISEIDNSVGERIKEEITKRHNGCGSLTNGYAGSNDDADDVHNYEIHNEMMLTKDHYHSHAVHAVSQSNQNESHFKEDQQLQQQQDVIVVTNSVTLNDPMREVLSNETSVDDIEPNDQQTQPQQQVNINRAAVDGVGDNDNVAHDKNLNEDSNNSHAREPVEQVVQMRNLQINEDGHEDVTASVQQQQSPHTTVVATVPVTVTVNPVVVVAAQSMTTNAEVPLVA
ncbi:uncharacterized protein [Musca autumnalis]|uniref:uncharacterized protein n=1 Tax=Musca autumnalis TaxID=221902 RepID=UPI003CF6E176